MEQGIIHFSELHNDSSSQLESSLADHSIKLIGEIPVLTSIDHQTALRALDLTTDGILVVREDGSIRYGNHPIENLFGWSCKELFGQNASLIIPDLFEQPDLDATKGEPPQPILKRGRRKDGTEFDVQVVRCNIDGEPGKMCFLLITDLTEKRKNEHHIQHTEKRFDLLFRAFPVPAYVWQRQGDEFILIDYNDADQYYTNSAIRRYLHRSLRFMYPEGGEIVEDIERCHREKSQFTREIPGYQQRSTGEVKDLVVTYVSLEPDIVVAIIDNVTAQHAALSELRKLSNAVKETADAVFITNKNGVIEYVNPAFEQITGYSRAKAIGNTPRILKSGQNSLEYYQRLWATILSGKPFRAQTVNRKRSGELIVVDQTITPMKDQEGRVVHFVSVLKDMTERIHLQEAQTELRLAGMVQQKLNPDTAPKIEGYDIAGAVFPAKANSGDYFDYLPMADQTVGLVVADVCGHGMAPALIMTEARAFLRSITRRLSDPLCVLNELNELIQPDLDQDNNFITTFFARIDPQQGLLSWSNAGNWPAYLFDNKGRLIRDMRTNGLPIGLFPDIGLKRNRPVRFPPGYLAVLLTDGIPEANNSSMQQFGVERTLDVIRGHLNQPAQEIISRVREEVLRFMGTAEQEDDQTIVIIKRNE